VVKNWLITGGCGFIGTSLIQKLLEMDSEVNVRVFDNLTVGSREDLAEVADFKEVSSIEGAPKGIELYVGDIRDADLASKSVKGCDCIVHLAANTGVGPSVEEPRVDMAANVIGTFNMLEAARNESVNKFIFASSGAPIGELKTPPIHEELPAHPVSPYGASKLAGEGYCSAYFNSFDINTICLRFGNVYGPRSKHKASVVAKFIKQAINGEVCEIFGDGGQTRDFIYIVDLVEALICAGAKDIGGEVFQIATNSESTVIDIANRIKKELLSRNIKMEIIFGSTRLGDVRRNFSDTTKAGNLLGWKSQTTLDDGIVKTVEYFLGTGQ
jgi:UDP-glucose 4-epimerase